MEDQLYTNSCTLFVKKVDSNQDEYVKSKEVRKTDNLKKCFLVNGITHTSSLVHMRLPILFLKFIKKMLLQCHSRNMRSLELESSYPFQFISSTNRILLGVQKGISRLQLKSLKHLFGVS